MSGQRTPGRWEYGGYVNADGSNGYTLTAGGRELATVPDGSAEGCANARLMAAAPDLLEALTEVRRTLRAFYRDAWDGNRQVGDNDGDALGYVIDRAIAKAKQ